MLRGFSTSKDLRIGIEIIVGITLSFIINFIMISIGYAITNSEKLKEYSVNYFGLVIYKIKNYGNKGIPVSNNMMFIGIVLTIIFVFIVEWVVYKRDKNGRV
ncbi:LlsX family protein [Lactobacillus crispatus]|uniref:LlsX family protein n=1 Tax=Lactobacillus crispatus TaxID=47770 RepID=UPI0022AC5DAA|nr:LlsX family protein [Lactobacillus crispatus]MCZ3643393.1 LlsX family protein [Lactobacillus crispatus]MCZ3645777.1 LlsX family protein [Lactobacillus crispatus]MCZ3648158.1 LlsX family protein [Lactobacillus crispatus]MCZ3650542.1 LlsX family protein [Lactobacillus crispatus]MCZ3652929.1 LlsX family protein [Lactobacillus crispatus]